MENNYWIIGSNKYSKDKYTEEKAIELSKSLINCVNCIDCMCCEDCTNCKSCQFCKDCHNCFWCFFVEHCTKCVEANFAHNLINQRSITFNCWEWE